MENKYLKRVKNGDAEAFSYFVEKYSDASYSLALGIVKNESEAEDIVQSSFFNAYKRLNTFRGDSKFSTWLYRIVVNESNQRLRRKKFKADANHPEITEIEAEKSADNPEGKERKKILRYAISQLKEKESLLIRLFYLCELSHDEISKVTGLTIANTKVILHRAKNNLKRVLESEYKDEFNPYP